MSLIPLQLDSLGISKEILKVRHLAAWKRSASKRPMRSLGPWGTTSNVFLQCQGSFLRTGRLSPLCPECFTSRLAVLSQPVRAQELADPRLLRVHHWASRRNSELRLPVSFSPWFLMQSTLLGRTWAWRGLVSCRCPSVSHVCGGWSWCQSKSFL